MKRKLSKLLGIGLTIALLTSLFVVAVPAAALTQPTVILTPASATIGAATTYTLTFTSAGVVNGVAGDQYVITFPAGTTVPVAPATTIEATAGIGGAVISPAAAPVGGAVGVVATGVVTMTLGAGQVVGNGALVQLTIAGVTNPSTPGTAYTISVKSQTGAAVPIEAAVVSAAYAINAPGLAPLAGLVVAYNSAGIKMSQSFGLISAAILNAGVGGKVEVGPGTYNEAIAAGVAGQTIIGTGAAGECIISGLLADMTVTSSGIVANTITIDNLYFKASVGGKAKMIVINPGALTLTTVKVQNCTIDGSTAGGVDVQAGVAVTLDKNTFNATAAPGVLMSVAVVTPTTISNNTFTVGATGTAISNVLNTGALTISKNTITGVAGAKGIIEAAGAAVAITESTLKTLNNALTINNGAAVVTMTKSTIDACGAVPATNAVEITAGKLNMNDNNLNNTPATVWAINIPALAGNALVAYFNDFAGNAKVVNCAAPSTALVDHNWWGAATGPAAGAVSLGLVTTPYLGADVSGGQYNKGAAALTTQTTTGVDVYISTIATGAPYVAAGTTIAVSKYAANPVKAVPPIVGTGKVVQYYDVYVGGLVGFTESVQIKFYGTVTPYTRVYFAGSLSASWATPTNWGVNTASGYVYVTITNASPTVLDLAGLPFAIVEDKTVAAPAITALAGGSPVIGAYNVPIDPMFTWGTVLGAIRYEIALSEDPTFTIIEWSYNVDQSFYKVDEALRYDTTYYWRVRGVLGEPFQEAGAWKTPSTPWATGIFTTEAEPAPVAEPITVEPVQPIVNVEVPPTKITVEPAAAAIPTYILWVIVIVGAVLVIALIVLIVRTRRVV